jgi:hypothetical protein
VEDMLREDELVGRATSVVPPVAGAALVGAVGLPTFATVTAGAFGAGAGAGAGGASATFLADAPFCCSTSARKRSTSARSALNSSRNSCCSVCAVELESAFAEDVAAPCVD